MVTKKRKHNRFTITFAMITKNEEVLLPQCLENIKNFVNEIIIVDNYSTDRTVKIAKRFGAIIYYASHNDNKSRLRNIYLRRACCDWILTLDADERIARKDIPRIINLTKNKKVMGYSFVSRLYTHDFDLLYDWFPCSGEYPEEERFSDCPRYINIDWGVRLFRNIRGLRYEGYPHETVDQLIIRNRWRIADTNIPIHHFRELRTGKINRDFARYRFELAKKRNWNVLKNNYRHYFRLGRDYLVLEKDYKNALKHLKKSIELKPDFIYSYFLLALIYKKRGLYEEAISTLKKALKIRKTYVGAHYLLGLAYELMNDLKLAEKELVQALDINPYHPMVLNSLGVVLGKQRRINQAIKCFRKAVEIHPAFRTARNNLKNIERLKLKK